MPEDVRQQIFFEGEQDFSAKICEGATMDSLDPEAIERFRELWIKKSRNESLRSLSPEQVLDDCELTIDGKMTYAALILFGRHNALGRFLPQSEVVYEFRDNESAGPASQREEFREGFFSFFDRLMRLLNLHNGNQHFHDGLFVWDIPTFDERIVREAVLNAVSHRCYQFPGSVFVRQYAQRLVVESPGGFPSGINPQNMLNRTVPRNRRIADVFCRCGLVERSGQGMDLMFALSVRQAKALPDYSSSDSSCVVVGLSGTVTDECMVSMMERIGESTLQTFTSSDFIVLSRIGNDEKVDSTFDANLKKLLRLGVVEKISRNTYILARRFYIVAGKAGVYTRKRGLDKSVNKELLRKHIAENSETGSSQKILGQVLPGLSRNQIYALLRELEEEGFIEKRGVTRNALWFAKSLG